MEGWRLAIGWRRSVVGNRLAAGGWRLAAIGGRQSAGGNRLAATGECVVTAASFVLPAGRAFFLPRAFSAHAPRLALVMKIALRGACKTNEAPRLHSSRLMSSPSRGRSLMRCSARIGTSDRSCGAHSVAYRSTWLKASAQAVATRAFGSTPRTARCGRLEQQSLSPLLGVTSQKRPPRQRSKDLSASERGSSVCCVRSSGCSPCGSLRAPVAGRRLPQAASRMPVAASRQPKAEGRQPKAEGRKPQAASRRPPAEGRQPPAESRID